MSKVLKYWFQIIVILMLAAIYFNVVNSASLESEYRSKESNDRAEQKLRLKF